METQVRRWQSKASVKQTTSAMVTKHWLMAEKHWTKAMCDRGFEWAKQNGLWQINPVHGEEEASLVIERLFQVEEQQCETTTQSGSFETQDPNGNFLTQEVAVEDAFKTTDGGDGVVTEGSGASFRLAFPRIQQNQSPLAIVPAFLDCMAKKMEHASKEQDWSNLQVDQWMATKIEEYAQDLSKKFDALSALQGEALTKNLDSQHTELKQQFAEITKTDVALNNILAESARRVVRLARIAGRRMRNLGAIDPDIEALGRCGSTSGKGKNNLSRNLHRTLAKLQKKLDVTVSMAKLTLRAGWPKLQTGQFDYPWIAWTSWAKYLLQKAPRYLLGGWNDISNLDELTVFSTFWDRYEGTDPSHPVFEDFLPEERKFVIPYCIRGDEGRGRNSQPTLVLAYQVVVHGRGLAYTATAGHSFGTRWLATIITDKVMTSATWDEIHKTVAADCCNLYSYGVTVQNQKFHFALVGIKGDWVYLRKAMKLASNFNWRSHRICHFCTTMEWWKFGPSSSLHQWNGEVVPAWKHDSPEAPLRMIPGATACRIRTDLAHTWAIGVGKEFASSCILLLCHVGVWRARQLRLQLGSAWEHFQNWRRVHKETCKLTGFSLKVFKITSLKQYPVLSGSGSDCVVVCKWLASLLADVSMKPHGMVQAHENLWAYMHYTAQACNLWFRGMYQKGLFLDAAFARLLVPYGWALVEGYGLLASAAAQQNLRLFRVKPKLHMQEHFPKEWELQLDAGAKYVINFLAFSCWSDEDFIGRCCRVSRATHPFTTGIRTIFRCLMAYKRRLPREIPE
ncbi:Uncharacterized protein SCF082_LOCUS8191 [Durusdinium trenchii]|uniref:Uncharacterized protein n=1 Tax=Durusdinium trenchii TaxID=1381693 RepID=A0ABP0IPE5_9DINO